MVPVQERAPRPVPDAVRRLRRTHHIREQHGREHAVGVGSPPDLLYKGGRDTLYRIHGTNEPQSIGRAVSSGCIRMLNADVIDLYDRVPIGTRVVVLPATGFIARVGEAIPDTAPGWWPF